MLKCTEIISIGYRVGRTFASLENIASLSDCMNNCDQNRACLGWSYKSKSKKCFLQASAGVKVVDDEFQGGSCTGKSILATALNHLMFYNYQSNMRTNLVRKGFAHTRKSQSMRKMTLYQIYLWSFKPQLIIFWKILAETILSLIL